MPITPLGTYHYDASAAIKEYNHENGDVYVTRSENFYAVHIFKQTSSYSEEYRVRGHMDAIAANEFFDMACRYVRGEIEWREPIKEFSCKYNPNKSKGCTDKNCPKKLGGPNYREFFMKSCPFRKARAR